MTIAALEDAIVAQLRAAFAGRLREVDHRPDRLDERELARILSLAPAAYVAFLGLRRRDRPDGTWDCTMGIYLVAANASGEAARRRGDGTTIGGYEMVQVAIGALDGWSPPEAAGMVEIRDAEQLQAEAFEKMGRTVYGLVAEVPVVLPRGEDAAPALVPFVTFDAAWDIPPFGNVAAPPPPPADAARDAGDRITLAQA
jgi:phage gp37-like protein